MTEPCKQEGVLAGLLANIDNLKNWQKQQNGSIADINKTLKEIQGDVQDIKLNLATPRGPSWAVATIMTVLSSVCVSLIVFVVTRLGGG